MNYFFTSDEHLGHKNILKYSSRPFKDINEHDETLIQNHNSVVGIHDTTIHAGDFTLWKNVDGVYRKYVNRLNGKQIFLVGSHDYWLRGKNNNQIWERRFGEYYIVVCHYAMHTWARSHYGSFHLFGHSHGKLQLDGKRWDCGVDNNEYFPISFDQVIKIMEKKGDNPEKYNKRR